MPRANVAGTRRVAVPGHHFAPGSGTGCRRESAIEVWISERRTTPTCTSKDMLPLADAWGFTMGRFRRECAGRLDRCDPADLGLMLCVVRCHVHR